MKLKKPAAGICSPKNWGIRPRNMWKIRMKVQTTPAMIWLEVRAEARHPYVIKTIPMSAMIRNAPINSPFVNGGGISVKAVKR